MELKDHFRFEKSEDPTTDDQYVLIRNEDITIQVFREMGPTTLIVHRIGSDGPPEHGNIWTEEVGEFPEDRLEDAFRLAIRTDEAIVPLAEFDDGPAP